MDKIKTQSRFADSSGETMIVELGGHVDQSNSYQLQKMFDDIITSGCYQVVVDFKDLYYMSSAGWGVFIGEIKRFRDNSGDIKLAHMNPDILDVFQMLEFFHILEDYVTVEEAVNTFKKSDEIDLIVDGEVEQVEIAEESPGNTIQDEGEMEIVVEDSADIQQEEQQAASQSKPSAEILSFMPENGKPGPKSSGGLVNELTPLVSKTEVKLHQLPLTEKVKHIIAQNPLMSTQGIRKVLRHEHFGYTKVGYFQLSRLLRGMDLNSKVKRYRYYRSC